MPSWRRCCECRTSVCVNKMDLVDYDEAVFTRIREEFKALPPASR